MKFDIVTSWEDELESTILTLAEAQFIFPEKSRELSHLIPGQRIKLGPYKVGYCILDTEIKSFYEL